MSEGQVVGDSISNEGGKPQQDYDVIQEEDQQHNVGATGDS